MAYRPSTEYVSGGSLNGLSGTDGPPNRQEKSTRLLGLVTGIEGIPG